MTSDFTAESLFSGPVCFACGTLRAPRAQSSSGGLQYSFARYAQIEQRKERDQIGRILRQPLVAHLREPELALARTAVARVGKDIRLLAVQQLVHLCHVIRIGGRPPLGPGTDACEVMIAPPVLPMAPLAPYPILQKHLLARAPRLQLEAVRLR